jgi:hypothetical protein
MPGTGTTDLNNTLPGDTPAPEVKTDFGGRRRSNGSRKNSWLSHVKATMKLNRGKSFKQVLKLAKKTYKKSQSQSQSKSQSSSQSQSAGRRRRRGGKRGGSSMKQSIDALLQKQQGGSGMSGKAPFGESAAPVS